MDTTQKVIEWKRLSYQLNQMKEQELKARMDLVDILDDDIFPNNTKQFDKLGIKITKGIKIKIHTDILDEKYKNMTNEEKECFQWKSHLIMKKYKGIDSENVNECITVYPATPTIKIIN